MKNKRWIGILVGLGLAFSVSAQNQNPTLQQSTSTTKEQERRQNKAKQKLQKEAMRKQQSIGDTPRTRQRTLRPDSLRRGGATKVDTIR